MRNFTIYKVRFKLPVCILVLPVHSLDDGACHKRDLVEAGETIRRCITGPRAACLWVPVQCIGPKVSRVIIKIDESSYFRHEVVIAIFYKTQN